MCVWSTDRMPGAVVVVCDWRTPERSGRLQWMISDAQVADGLAPAMLTRFADMQRRLAW